jgi:hypothetical protein
MRTSLGSRRHRPLGIFQQLGVSRLGGQFLASAKQLLIPDEMTVANLTTVNECNWDFPPISLSLGLFSWIRKPLYSYRYSGWEKNEVRNLANTASSFVGVFRQIH